MGFSKNGNFKTQVPTISIVITVERFKVPLLQTLIETYKDELPSQLNKLLADIQKQLPRE